MCCLYRGVAAEGGLWARLEAVGMSVEMSAGVLAARSMEGMQFTLGPTMAFRRETIRHMGGFNVTADYCADDFVLGNETHKLGQTVILSHHAIDHMVLHSSFVGSLKHQVRWMKSTRFSRPKGHFGTALTFSIPFGLLALAAAVWLGHPIWGVAFSPGASPRVSRFPSPLAAASSATRAGLACSCSIRSAISWDFVFGPPATRATASSGAAASSSFCPAAKCAQLDSPEHVTANH